MQNSAKRLRKVSDFDTPQTLLDRAPAAAGAPFLLFGGMALWDPVWITFLRQNGSPILHDTPLGALPRPSFVEDFDPLEATTVRHRGLENPIPSIFEDFDPPEATTPLNRGSKKPGSSIFEDLRRCLLASHSPRISESGLFEISCAQESQNL